MEKGAGVVSGWLRAKGTCAEGHVDRRAISRSFGPKVKGLDAEEERGEGEGDTCKKLLGLSRPVCCIFQVAPERG